MLFALTVRIKSPRPDGRSTIPPQSAPPPPPHAPLSTSICSTVDSIGRDACLPRRVLFVGGLQRSGTSTLAALLDELPGVGGLHFDIRNATHMESAPWKRLIDVHTGRWMKFAYFKEVISTGGAEGKLLQDVFPYRYAVWDAKLASPYSLLAQPSALSPLLNDASRGRLWAQWRRFWTSPAHTLVDKSPENILMAPFLQAMFGRERTSFVFVMRHPLCWALVAAKWGCLWEGDATTAKAPQLECLSHLVDVWLAVHEQIASQLESLADASLIAAESDNGLRDPSWLQQLAAKGALQASSPPNADAWARTQTDFREASHGYVHCFLRGFAPRRTRVIDGDCRKRGISKSKIVEPPLEPQTTRAQRMAWLRKLDDRVGSRVRALGYTLNLTRVVSKCCESRWDDWTHSGGAASPDERAIAIADSSNGHATIGLDTGNVALVIGTSFLSAFNGMQQRAAQLAAAVSKLGYQLHFISLGPLNSTEQCSNAVPRVICHAVGDSTAQYNGFVRWARAARATPSLVLVGFTSLTLEVSRALLRLPKSSLVSWRDGKYDPSHVPKAHRCAELLDQSQVDFPTAASILFTDDIHFERTRHVLALGFKSGNNLHPIPQRVLDASKQFELKTYSKARLVVLISTNDRTTLTKAMPSLRTGEEEAPAVSILPFGASALADAEVAPLSKRVRGRLLFVGTCHPVARASVSWLVRVVMPKIMRIASAAGQANAVQLRIAGNGWKALASEPPYAEWVEKGNVIMLGKLSDEELDAEYQSSRLFVSPLLNATGIATKNFHAMGKGLPVLLHGCVLRASCCRRRRFNCVAISTRRAAAVLLLDPARRRRRLPACLAVRSRSSHIGRRSRRIASRTRHAWNVRRGPSRRAS